MLELSRARARGRGRISPIWVCALAWLAVLIPAAQPEKRTSASPQTLRVGAVQLASPAQLNLTDQVNVNRTLAACRASIRSSGNATRLLVLPEAIFWSFALEGPVSTQRTRLLALAQDLSGPTASSAAEALLNQPTLQHGAQASLVQSLQALAREAGLYLVVNMIARVPCTNATHASLDPEMCRPDGWWLFNTDVAIDPTGQLLAIYHKQHLFGTAAVLDQPATNHPTTFSVDGTQFGLLVCYDMEFAEPVSTLLASGVRHFAVSSLWENDPPLFDALMFQQAWSRHFDAVLVVANRGDAVSVSGGGVYVAGQSLNVSQPNGVTTLTVASVPSAMPVLLSAQQGSRTTNFQRGTILKPLAWLNDDVFACASTFSAAEPMACQSWAHASTHELTVTKNNVTCHATITMGRDANQSAGGPRLVLAAQDALFTYYDTPSALHVQACMLMACDPDSTSNNDTTLCRPIWTPLNLTAVHVVGTGFAQSESILPMIRPIEVREEPLLNLPALEMNVEQR